MKQKKLELVSLFICIVNLLASVLYILQLPETVPTHFNLALVCDGLGSPWVGLIMPIATLIMDVVFLLCDRLGKTSERNRAVFAVCMVMLTLYLTAMNWWTLYMMGSGVQLGEKLDGFPIGWSVCLLVAFLFIGFGNYLPLVQQNKMLGIRISYTLNNPYCWQCTHRFAGRLWVVTGLLCAVLGVVGIIASWQNIYGLITLFLAITINMALPCIYAYRHQKPAE